MDAFSYQNELWKKYQDENQKEHDRFTKAILEGHHVVLETRMSGPYIDIHSYYLDDGACITIHELASIAWANKIPWLGGC